MKHLNLIFLSAVIGIVFSPICFGQGSQTGGGAQLESAFRLRGIELISSVANSPAANNQCSYTVMKIGLESTKIRVVDTLIDPSTHFPITNQNLDAWTSPGDMQLLERSWRLFLNSSYVPAPMGKSVDTLILHEIYRSTGVCDDENFKISDSVLELIRTSVKLSKEFDFKYSRYGGDYIFNQQLDHFTDYCTGDFVDGTKMVCLSYLRYTDSSLQISLTQGTWKQVRRESYLDERKVLGTYSLNINQTNSFKNMLQNMSPDLPFKIIMDLQAGTAAYGFDASRLIPFDK